MYAWFADRTTARQFVDFQQALAARAVRPDVAKHAATTHALALGETIVLHPRQRSDDGYVVPIGAGCVNVERYRGRSWWRRALWHVEVVVVGFAIWWALGFVLGLVEVAPW